VTVERVPDDRGARRAYRLLAATALGFTLVVVIASAYLRHWQAGLSCAPWPACYARADMAMAASESAVRAARIVHRLSAMGVTAAILGLLLIAWTQRPVWMREALTASGALAVAAALALLGIVTPGSKLPIVVLGNLLGGHGLLALVAAAWALASEPSASGRRGRLLAAALLAGTFVITGLGGLLGAHYLSGACPTLLDCSAATAGREVSLRALFSAPPTADGRFAAPDWAAALHVIHRLAAFVWSAVAAVVIYRLRRDRPRLALALLVTLVGLLALGVTAISTQPALAVVVAHNAAAACIAALLAIAVVPTQSTRGGVDANSGTTVA